MKRILATFISFIFLFNVNAFASETLSIEKQLVGIVGAISGTVKTETRELKTGDKISSKLQFIYLPKNWSWFSIIINEIITS